jgi:hypothetical protein
MEVTVTVFTFSPSETPVTSTVKMQDARGKSEAPDREMLSWNGSLSETVNVPLHWVKVALDTFNPVGSMSMKDIPVKVVAIFGLLIENVRDVDSPDRIELAPKDLLIWGGANTVIVSTA